MLHAASFQLPPCNYLFYITTTLFVAFYSVKVYLGYYIKQGPFYGQPPSYFLPFQDEPCTYQVGFGGETVSWRIKFEGRQVQHYRRVQHFNTDVFFKVQYYHVVIWISGL